MIAIPVLFQDIDTIDYEKLGMKRPENVGSFEKTVIFFNIDAIFETVDVNEIPLTVIKSGGVEYTTRLTTEQIVELVIEENKQ